MTKSFFNVFDKSGSRLSYVIYGMATLLVVNWLINIFFYKSGPIIHIALLNAGVMVKLAKVVNKESN